jgi:hypothetical protein
MSKPNYEGQFVVMDPNDETHKVIAHGFDGGKVVDEARALGVPCPVVIRCPKKGETFLY